MGIYNLGGGGGTPELQAKEATPLITNAQQIILPDEGYDGLSKVTVNPMPTGTLKTPTVNSIGYVSAGVQTAGYFDTSATSGLQLSTQSAKTITPTTYSQTAVASGKYTTGAVTVNGDSDLVPSNIKSGVNIFGVIGTYEGDSAVSITRTVQSSPTTTPPLLGSLTVSVPASSKKINGLSFYCSNSLGNYATPSSPTALAWATIPLGAPIPMNSVITGTALEAYGYDESHPRYDVFLVENAITINFSSGLITVTAHRALFGRGYYTFVLGLG